ncbi:MAG: hypothetical protein EXR75_15550 [Myxococcales bacterium]|nr:hypothetical protein [Myxococcales bacterium]
MTDDLVKAIREHPRGAELATVIWTLVKSAADERQRRLGDGLEELMREHDLGNGAERGIIEGVDVLEVMARAPTGDGTTAFGPDEAVLISALAAVGVAADRRRALSDPARLAASLAWLGANTALDVLGHVDATLGADADALWSALVCFVRDGGPGRRRGEALYVLASIPSARASSAETAVILAKIGVGDAALGKLADRLATGRGEASRDRGADGGDEELDDDGGHGDDDGARDRASAGAPRVTIEGVLVPAPLGPVRLVLEALTGVLILRALGRAFAGIFMRRRYSGAVTVERRGLAIHSVLELFGRTVLVRDVVIPFDNIARAAREARYPRLPLYVGMLALGVGTYVGATLVIDGGRVGSPTLIGIGAVVFSVGLALDLVLVALWPNRGRHRLVFVPRRGSSYALVVRDEREATELLRAIALRA